MPTQYSCDFKDECLFYNYIKKMAIAWNKNAICNLI